MHTIRVRRPFTLATTLFTAALVACGSSSDTATVNLDLNGNWTATKYQFVSVNHVGTSLDLVAQGYTVTLVGTATAWTVTAVKNGATFDIEIGTYTATATSITFTTTNHANNTTTVFAASKSGNTITLTNGTGTFDFGTGNGTEAVTLNITLVKQ